MLAAEGFVQVVPRFPERVTVCAPRGMRAALSRAAERERIAGAGRLLARGKEPCQRIQLVGRDQRRCATEPGELVLGQL